MKETVLRKCREVLPGWADLSVNDVRFTAPKGFSSFTMAVQPIPAVDPSAVFYRHLTGKDNAVLDAATERAVFTALGEARIAARLHFADATCRIEEMYSGRSLTREDLRDPATLSGIAAALHRFHHLPAEALPALPPEPFFVLLHRKWGPLARAVVEGARDRFEPQEQQLCRELEGIYSEETHAKALRFVPPGPLRPCHNDTYHGNVMRLDGGEIRLVDFEFTCLNHRAFDFSNLFAETVMRHGLPDAPHFGIAEPDFGADEIGALVDLYLDSGPPVAPATRAAERAQLVRDIQAMIPLSDYMYAMAALPLAVKPIQKIRFIPYAHQRFQRFLKAYEDRFEAPSR